MRYRALVVAVVLTAAASAPAAAQIKLDMNQITCGDWLGYGPADRDFVRFFMSGYYNAAANNNVLDYNRLFRATFSFMPRAPPCPLMAQPVLKPDRCYDCLAE